MRRESVKPADSYIAVRTRDRSVVDFSAPRSACDRIMPVKLGTRLAAGAGHLKKKKAYREKWEHHYSMLEEL